MRISRRNFGSLLGASTALSFAPLANLLLRGRAEAQSEPLFGPLTPKVPANQSALPAELRDIAFMSLPDGFAYKLVSYRGQTMRDGNLVPGATDGMAAFQFGRGRIALVRNHELTTNSTPHLVPDATYDARVHGGTTTVILDRHNDLVAQYGSLAGTERNCAGGRTPWYSWLTCEEPLLLRNDGLRHGYVFEVPALGLGRSAPLVRLGRFNHEAVAIDPATSIVYETEDRADGLFYRFVPAVYGDLAGAGKLQALQLLDWPDGVHTVTGFLGYLNQPLATAWVDIEDYDPAADTVRVEGRDKGAARFSRGEGCSYRDGSIYFVCSDGGDLRAGQVFAYDPAGETLRLIVESTDRAVLDAPDNVTVHPDGSLYLCEDGDGSDNIVRVDRDGALATFAQNAWSDSEWAGVCFSPAGRTMFVNMQNDGLTFAIRGPFRRRWSSASPSG